MNYSHDNPFAKILRGELSARVVYEDELFLCFHTIAPVSKVHVLLIPKEPYISYQDFIRTAPQDIIVGFFKLADKIAKDLGIEESYKLVTNHGSGMGQEVFHFHLHIMGGGRI
jgi:histidine triad (HIT) family protein